MVLSRLRIDVMRENVFHKKLKYHFNREWLGYFKSTESHYTRRVLLGTLRKIFSFYYYGLEWLEESERLKLRTLEEKVKRYLWSRYTWPEIRQKCVWRDDEKCMVGGECQEETCPLKEGRDLYELAIRYSRASHGNSTECDRDVEGKERAVR